MAGNAVHSEDVDGLPADLRRAGEIVMDPASMPLADGSRRAQRFGTEIRRLIAKYDPDQSDLRDQALDVELSRPQRFAALYAALHLMRRRGDFSDYVDLVRTTQTTFGNEAIFSTFITFSNKFVGDLGKALQDSENSLMLLPDTPGVKHLRAVIVADLLDRSEPVDDAVFAEARELVDSAILSDPSNPSFHETSARLRLHARQYGHARQAIRTAIVNDSSSEPGNMLRLANRRLTERLIDYEQRYTAQFDDVQEVSRRLHEDHEATADELARVRDELSRVRDQTLTMLALFAALIAFVVTSVQVSVALDLVSILLVVTMLFVVTTAIIAATVLLLGLSTPRRAGLFVAGGVALAIVIIVVAGVIA